MKLGFVGLGKMGQPMVARLLKAGHEVMVYDVAERAVSSAVERGAAAADTVGDMVSQLDPVIIWLMIPPATIDSQLEELLGKVGKGAIIIDGGNSNFRSTIERAQLAAAKGIQYIDVGTSGGALGVESGYCLMVGGEKAIVQGLAAVFEALAQPNGWLHVGPSGTGHYVKMVHNAIEYGIMQSLAEGYQLLQESAASSLDLAAISELWQHGSINESLLNKLTGNVLASNPTLEGIDGYVAETGEGKWAAKFAKEHNVPMPALEAALATRARSQMGKISFATKILAAQRNAFGGHDINKK